MRCQNLGAKNVHLKSFGKDLSRGLGVLGRGLRVRGFRFRVRWARVLGIGPKGVRSMGHIFQAEGPSNNPLGSKLKFRV